MTSEADIRYYLIEKVMKKGGNMATVFDVADYILMKMDERGERLVSTMKLQKLCYYSQAWSLAWDEKPLFDSRIEAWVNGPVVRELFAQHKGRMYVSAGFFGGDPGVLTQDEKNTIDAVIDAYGHLDGYSLASLTHEEAPWLDARGGIAPNILCNREITQDSMRDFYMGIAIAQGN